MLYNFSKLLQIVKLCTFDIFVLVMVAFIKTLDSISAQKKCINIIIDVYIFLRFYKTMFRQRISNIEYEKILPSYNNRYNIYILNIYYYSIDKYNVPEDSMINHY